MPMMSAKTKTFFNNKTAFPYMTMMNVYDYEEVGETANPGFLIPPTNIEGIKDFLLRKWTDNSQVSWAFNPNADINQIWPMDEQLRYSNPTLRTAGMGGFPLGDLYRWGRNQPHIYQNWLAQRSAEYQQIWNLLRDGVTSVEENTSGIPQMFELSQNYPNPFNPTTWINYSLPRREQVSLKVYNVLGMEIATLVEREQEAGRHTVAFDATNFASGVYFYRLKAGNTVLSKKMALVK
jgi:hypothetical protein